GSWAGIPRARLYSPDLLRARHQQKWAANLASPCAEAYLSNISSHLPDQAGTECHRQREIREMRHESPWSRQHWQSRAPPEPVRDGSGSVHFPSELLSQTNSQRPKRVRARTASKKFSLTT